MVTRLFALFFLVMGLAVAPAANVKSGSATCPSSGSKQVSTTSLKVIKLDIMAPLANTGTVYIGGSTISSTTGIPVTNASGYSFPPVSNSASYDLSNIYFACSQSADSITFLYLQ